MGGKRVPGASPRASSESLGALAAVPNRLPPSLLRVMNESNSFSCDEAIAVDDDELGKCEIDIGRGEK
jgi:hypothetical protein